MKFQIGKNVNFEFDKDDAKIIIPLIIGGVIYWYEPMLRLYCVGVITVYYLFYFYSEATTRIFKNIIRRIFFKCPKCQSRKLILQGYQSYNSDEHHAFYLCLNCNVSSIETVCGLYTKE